MKFTILRFTMFLVMGAITSIAGLDLSTWEFWVILSASVTIGAAAYIEGVNSK